MRQCVIAMLLLCGAYTLGGSPQVAKADALQSLATWHVNVLQLPSYPGQPLREPMQLKVNTRHQINRVIDCVVSKPLQLHPPGGCKMPWALMESVTVSCSHKNNPGFEADVMGQCSTERPGDSASGAMTIAEGDERYSVIIDCKWNAEPNGPCVRRPRK